MKRDIENEFLGWKSRSDRKPLVLMGARQVGKTWLMKDFGQRNFARVHLFDFVDTPDLASVFSGSKSPDDIIPKLEVIGGVRIDREKDVLVFDEIQDCGDALNSLKYFYEKCPQLAVMTAGSLLGVNLKRNGKSSAPTTYPVGKVELLDVEPISFPEFLRARDGALWEYYQSISGLDLVPEIFHRKLWDAYLLYLFVGGMPEAVSSYLENGDPIRVAKIQRDLIALYENDIVKYNGAVDAAKILLVLRSIVPQLAKENGKFIYGAMKDGARARGYEEAIEWLVSARMVRRVLNLSAPVYPLASYGIRNAFKLYLNDVGMLREMSGVTGESIMLNKGYAFKGRLVENYVVQQLAGRTTGPVHYYAERSDREIDFMFQYEDEVVPVEVKAGEEKRAESFKAYVNRHHPRYAIRFSSRNLQQDGGFVNIPLYLAPRFANLFAEIDG